MKNFLFIFCLSLLGFHRQAMAACTFNSMGTLIDFDLYASGGSEKLDDALLTFTCTPTLPALTVSYTLGIDGGLANNFNPRRLYLNGDSGSGNRLSYNLYTDSSRAVIIGDGMPGSPPPSASNTCTGLCTYRVFGTIAGGQNAVPGAYSDTVRVILNF
jgi:spore coat protein U-like protein